MAGCDHNCETCSSKCEKKDFIIHTNQYSKIRKTIGIVSGKGGVGKSLVTSMLAVCASKNGYKSAILDGDILGPSIPKIFGINQKAYGDETGKFIYPANGPLEIDVISTTMLLENEDDPIIWRGSMVSNMVKQFYSDVIYGEQDVLFIDMPPGTGDVPLTVMQTIPIKGVVMVSIPQDMISMIVSKSINMARKMNIDIFGVIENMSYIKCPDCDKTIKLFNGENTENFLKDMNVELLGELPMHRAITNYGSIELIEEEEEVVELFDPIVEKIIEKSKKKLVL